MHNLSLLVHHYVSCVYNTNMCMFIHYVFDIGWKDISSEATTSDHILLLSCIERANETPSIAMTMAMGENFTWKLHIQSHILDPPTLRKLCFLAYIAVLHVKHTSGLEASIDSIKICPGIPDEKFHPVIESRKGKFTDQSGKQCHIFYRLTLLILLCLINIPHREECCGLSGILTSTIRTSG